MTRFETAHDMDEEDIRHHLLSGRGTGPIRKGRREGQVVWSYVFEVKTLSITTKLIFKINYAGIGSRYESDNRLHFLFHASLVHYATKQ